MWARWEYGDMPIETSLTALLGIRHPILLAPMDVIAGARLATAVSAAGGFGILGGGYGDGAWLRQETAKFKQSAAASMPFGIGFITWSLARQPEVLDVALDAEPTAIMLSFGDPKPFASRIKAAGVRVICQVQDEDMARQALDAGADVLIAQGTEAGGHGASRTTLDIVPAIVDLAAGRVPVVRCRRHWRWSRARRDDDAWRRGRAARHAVLCEPGGRWPRRGEKTYLCGDQRQHRQRHRVRSVA